MACLVNPSLPASLGLCLARKSQQDCYCKLNFLPLCLCLLANWMGNKNITMKYALRKVWDLKNKISDLKNKYNKNNNNKKKRNYRTEQLRSSYRNANRLFRFDSSRLKLRKNLMRTWGTKKRKRYFLRNKKIIKEYVEL